MKRYFSPKRGLLLSICAGLAALAVAAVDPPRTVSILGTFGTTFDLIPTPTPGVLDDPIEGVGNIPDLGLCTIVVQQTVDFRTDPPSLNPSNWVLTFIGGDQLTVSFTGTGTPDAADPAFIQLSGAGTITGGTGRFQGATGELRAPGVAHQDTPPGVFPGHGHGSFVLEGLVRLSKP
jgi:hypothetical protein